MRIRNRRMHSLLILCMVLSTLLVRFEDTSEVLSADDQLRDDAKIL
jgi:hypothetical protein